MWIIGPALALSLAGAGMFARSVNENVDRMDAALRSGNVTLTRNVELLQIEVQRQALVDADRARDVEWIKATLTRVEDKLSRIAP